MMSLSLSRLSLSPSGVAGSQFEVLPSTVADHSSMNSQTQESWEQLKTVRTATTHTHTHTHQSKPVGR